MTKDLNFAATGKSILTSRIEQVRQQIRHIILTCCAIPDKGIYGEVYGIPEFGCTATINLWEHLITTDINELKCSIYNGLSKIKTIQVFLNDIEVEISDIEQRAMITAYFKDLIDNTKQKVVI